MSNADFSRNCNPFSLPSPLASFLALLYAQILRPEGPCSVPCAQRIQQAFVLMIVFILD